MLSMASLNRGKPFRPIGNSPAVNLTQLLPPKEPAKILLLGCGDVRHILFTTHTDDRSVDFTCCDAEPAIIARNIIILTLIIDSKSLADIEQIWFIQLHFKISNTTLKLLRDHIQTLLPLCESLQSWRYGDYGKSIDFCDEGSLKKVYEILTFWINAETTELAKYIHKSQDHEKCVERNDWSQAPRALSPAFTAHSDAGSVIENFPIGHDHYWKNGTTSDRFEVLRTSINFNPCFVPLQQDTLLAPDIHSFSGFHLAAGYVPSEENKNCKANLEADDLTVMAHVAKREFSSWVESFRKQAASVTVRYFVGDALAFCTLLQKHVDDSELGKDCVYRDQTNFEPIILDVAECASAQHLALSGFDVIDTSSLADEVGALPLFTAVRPLLKSSPLAAIFTDMHLGGESTSKASLETLLCGEVQTISALVGLVLVDIATNNSPLFGDELSIVGDISHCRHRKPEGRQVQLSRLTWKCPLHWYSQEVIAQGVPKSITLQENELANILHGIWRMMFGEHDSASKNKSSPTTSSSLLSPVYRHSHFIALLGFSTRYIDSGGYAGSQCMQLVSQDDSLPQHHKISAEILQWLYMLGFPTTVFHKCLTMAKHPSNKLLRTWEDIPPIVAITIEVPRAHLIVFAAVQGQLSTAIPIECCIKHHAARPEILSNPIFTELRIGFGTLCTKGTRNTGTFEVSIKADPAGWSGGSSLFVSFYAPANYLLAQKEGARLSLRLSPSKFSRTMFASKIGVDLKIFETNSEDHKHVYITKHLPGLSSQALPCVMKHRCMPKPPGKGQKINNTVTAHAANGAQRITSISSRADILDGGAKKRLKRNCTVTLKYLTPFTQEITLDDSIRFVLAFPIPVSESAMKLRIARKSSYIELVADTTHDFHAPSSFRCPLLSSKNGPVLWNTSRVNLTRLPHLLTNDRSEFGALAWLAPHVTMALTSTELVLQEKPHQTDATKEELVLADLKDTIFFMFMSHTGIHEQQSSIFVLFCLEDQQHASIVLFVSSLRLDLANRTVILDAALLPSITLLPNIVPLDTKPVQKAVSRDELCLLKMMLPVWAERCRTWDHKPSCEYISSGKIPTTLQPDRNFLCSCGQGEFPEDFKIADPNWDRFSKYATRVAISPILFSPLVDNVYIPPSQGEVEAGGARVGGKMPTVPPEVWTMPSDMFPPGVIPPGMMPPAGIIPPSGMVPPEMLYAGYMVTQAVVGMPFSRTMPGVPVPDMDTLDKYFAQVIQSNAHKCFHCGKEDSGVAGGQWSCPDCTVVSFCSKECKQARWVEHKGICAKLKKTVG